MEKARTSPQGWTRRELDKLYNLFGFVMYAGKKHDIVKHPKLPKTFVGTLTRSSKEIHPDYIRHAVSLIEELLRLEESE